jgi:hypothetical protein
MSPNHPKRYREAIASLRTKTAPSSASVRRVRARLDRQLQPTTDLLEALPSPTWFQIVRLRARILADRRTAPRLGWLIPAGGLAFAAAAAAAGVLYVNQSHTDASLTTQGTGAPIEATTRCDLDIDLTLGVGVPEECLPTTAAGWLTRARALEDRGAPNADVLAAADAGVALGADAAVRSELEVTRMGALLRSGRTTEALVAAEAALSGAGPDRAEELHRAAARLALAAGDCSRAIPHLDALTSPTPDESAHAERCR